MKIYAVIDTNIVISALMAKSENSPPLRVVRAVAHQKIIPIIHEQIVKEYVEVSHRMKFHFSEEKIQKLLNDIVQNAKFLEPLPYPHSLPDEKDRIFLEVALAARSKFGDAFLITGNKKHFPDEKFVVSPDEMMEILK